MNVRLFALFCCVSFLLFSSGAPIWAKAPSTAKIVFSSKRDGNSDIWTMNPDGSDPVRLTQHAAGDSFPVWSRMVNKSCLCRIVMVYTTFI